jgi:stage II sporulation protein AA (anti-sigma F factor antagonist)
MIVAKGDVMQIKSRVLNDVLYVLLCGELDEHSATYTKITLDEIFDKPNFSKIVVDLSELDFMDSTGIGVLIGRYKRMKDKDIPIFIANPSSHAEKIFKITGLYNLMPKIV